MHTSPSGRLRKFFFKKVEIAFACYAHVESFLIESSPRSRRIPSAVVHESRTHTMLLQLCAAAECVGGRLQRALPFILLSIAFSAMTHSPESGLHINWRLAILG